MNRYLTVQHDLIQGLLIVVTSILIGISSVKFGVYNLVILMVIIGVLALCKLLKYLKYSFYIFLCVIISIPYRTLLAFRLDLGGISLNLLDFLIIPVVIGLITTNKKDKIAFNLNKTLILFFIFVFYGVVMGFLLKNPLVLVVRETRFFIYTAIMAIGVLIRVKVDGYRSLTKTFVIGSIFASLFQLSGILNYNSESINSIRSIGVMTNFIPIGFSLLLTHTKYSFYSKSLIYWRYPLLIVMLSAIIISLTRGVWIELVIMQFLLFSLVRGQRIYILKQYLVLFVLSLFPLTFVTLYMGADTIINSFILRIQSIFNPLEDNNTINYRLLDSISQFNYVLQNRYWFSGYGFGNVMYNVNFIGFAGFNELVETDYTENSYLYYLWKTGVLGCLIPFLFFVKNGLRLLFNAIRAEDIESKLLYGIFGGALVAISISTAFSGAFAPGQGLIICGAIVGIGMSIDRKLCQR